MNILVIGIAVVIVIVSAVFARPTKAPEVLSTTSEPSPAPQETPVLTIAPTIVPKGTIFQLQYPGSTVAASTSTTLILNSSEDPDKITDWYKEKIKAGGYNVKSFVTTKTNGEVLNKLAGANGGGEVNITVSQASVGSNIEISVNLK